MDILNTIQGVAITAIPDYFFIFIITIVVGAVLFFGGMSTNSVATSVVGLFIAVISLVFAFSTDDKPTGEYTPTQHEVILTDENYIIDATKYNVVEKRGKIVVIEEIKEAIK